ncbi:hypothetical protein EDE08_101641 [Bradyrhizobium sp. R2.2-H]|jgi:hypothetical protein|uniref:hypothetical protein n=1 Tax=unclassified Bradyrhizobium TaxID=2631580 RepID=UPI0010441AD4|nr:MULTISPECIES: hypothetical protein [unclassified Bradyrhizobium]TCU78859.1 hypothetical protein EDE10_101642 [Bradyrhizobium sp. Y-H1]TCU80942.1 hypothetical protein EDE08_101641 [Bradyrhizobium sp. R2.2-H]
MDDAELHFPGQEQEAPAPEAPKDEPKPEEAPAPEDKAPEADKPEDKPEDKPADEPAPEVPLPKKRSIYDDLKDTRKEKNAFKDAAVAALEAQGIKLTGKETAEELQALAKKTPSDAPAPAAPSTPTDELEAYAQEHGLDAPALARLAEVLGKRIPAAQLSEADRQELETLKGWKATKDAEEQRAAEDKEVLATAPTVKTQLEIHDDAELDAVMKEIVRLSHTPEFHDKEVDYIVFRNKDALSKLVSPKKPSFEGGGSPAEAAPEVEPDFSSGKGITPAMAEKASQGRGGSSLEIRKGK